MKQWTHFLTALQGKALVLSLSLLLLVSCGSESPAPDPGADSPATQSQEETPSEDQATPDDLPPEGDSQGKTMVNMTMLTGPTGMGAAKLMADAQAQTTLNDYTVEVLGANDQVAALLTSGDTDIAALSTSVAATLFHKDVPITLLAVNTQGVLYLLEKGDSVQDMADLKGKTLWTTGQGANPEYILNKLLVEAGLDPEADVDIQWMTAEEVAAKMVTEEAGVCMLPVPATTALLLKDQGIREALDLSAQWSSVVGSSLPMGCVVVRNAFLEEHPQAVTDFLTEYEASITFMQEAGGEQAQLVSDFGITPSPEVAQEALPKSNIIFQVGTEMKTDLEAYYTQLFLADPQSIGGGQPYDDFYYLP